MSNQIAKQEDGLKSLVSRQDIKEKFESMLGKKAPGFLSSILSAVSSNKMLKEADPMSVIQAASIAATMDLPINQSLGFAHIVPYKGAAQFQLGWKGFVQLAMRSGQYKTINLTPVLEGQIKSHNPFTGEMDLQVQSTSNKAAGYLLYFKLLNGYEKYFYMTAKECEAHGKKYSASYAKGFGQWKDNFEAMALKTVCKLGLSKYGILSVELQKAVEFDQAAVSADGTPIYIDNVRDVNESGPITQEDVSKPNTKPARLAAKINEGKKLHNHAPGAEKVVGNQPEETL